MSHTVCCKRGFTLKCVSGFVSPLAENKLPKNKMTFIATDTFFLKSFVRKCIDNND